MSSPKEADPGGHQAEEQEDAPSEAVVAGGGGTSVDETVDGASQAVHVEMLLLA